MAPIVASLISGAVQIFTNRDAFKENLKSKSTKAAVASAVAAAVAPEAMPPDSLESALTQIALGVVSLVLFFYRRA